MCGILGTYSFQSNLVVSENDFQKALDQLEKRGPDAQGIFPYEFGFLGHRRLSIIDTSEGANQPMHSSCQRYILIFNGEIYNFKALKVTISDKTYSTSSDTEVLMKGLMEFGVDFICKLNGFFAFAFYDTQEKTLLVARDRFGIKPLYLSVEGTNVVFGSELKAIIPLVNEKKVDTEALTNYSQFNYLPFGQSILENIEQLEPGHYCKIAAGKIKKESYYSISKEQSSDDYMTAVAKVAELLKESVKKRMFADVPVGTFLSGGVDSSIISYLAKQVNPNLKTYSIGYSDEPMFDESKYAEMVAKHIGSEHKTIYLDNKTLLGNLDEVLDYIDEPFADSSALAVYALCKEVSKEVTVALSGDGSDEMLAGYNKHRALYLADHPSLSGQLAKVGAPLWKVLPKGRNGKLSNLFRKLDKFATTSKLEGSKRYLQLASFLVHDKVQDLLLPEYFSEDSKNQLLAQLDRFGSGMNGDLRKDMAMVLTGDMLVKVDRMSMANSLEVRVPFLDHSVVDYIFSLPQEYKIDQNHQKKLLRDGFKEVLPLEVFDRAKHGFEVPLLGWFRGALRSRIEKEWLEESFIKEQGIFQPDGINEILKRLDSADPGDVAYEIWMLIVFQNWYKKYMN